MAEDPGRVFRFPIAIAAKNMPIEASLQLNIDRLSGFRFRVLTFSPLLERRYQEERDAFRRRRMWIESLVALLLYVAYAIALSALHLNGYVYANVIRSGVLLPLACLVVGLLFLDLRSSIREGCVFGAACLIGTTEAFFCRSNTSHSGLTILAALLVTNIVARLRFSYAALTTCWAIMLATFIHFTIPHSDVRLISPAPLLFGSIALLLLLTNYGSEREARLAFLRVAEKQQSLGDLTLTNNSLAAAASTDSLTGIANRFALEEHLKTLWPELADAGQVCSAILVDIDHFKTINDRYGHLYGDRVLKRIARLLSETLRGEKDFIVRFGGEEFLILLPGTPVHLAYVVAERLRVVVELAGLPSLRADDPSLGNLRSTISFGVAAAFVRFYPDPNALIGAADEALYEAKRDGRNRTRGAEAFSNGL